MGDRPIRRRPSAAARTTYRSSALAERRLRGLVRERFSGVMDRLIDYAPEAALAAALSAKDEKSGIAYLVAGVADLPAVRDPLAGAIARSIDVKQRLLEEAGGGMAVKEAAGVLGLSPQGVYYRLNVRSLLAVATPSDTRLLPAFQFESPEMTRRMGEVLPAFGDTDSWVVLSLLFSGAPALGGVRPVDALREGDVEAVIRAARAHDVD